MKHLVGVIALGCFAPLAWGAAKGPLVVEDLTSQTVTAQSAAVAPTDNVLEEDISATNAAGLYELISQLQLYQQQLAELRGEVEELRNTIELMKVSDRERYIDLDTRINALTHQPSNQSGDSSAASNEAERKSNQAATQTSADKDGEAAYVAARNQTLAGDPSAAISALKAYLKDYPQGKYVPDTHYWLGEMYRVDGSKEALARSENEFALLADTFPDSPKAPTALYKLAEVQSKQNKLPATKVSLNRLIKQFPDSEEANLAKQMLETL